MTFRARKPLSRRSRAPGYEPFQNASFRCAVRCLWLMILQAVLVVVVLLWWIYRQENDQISQTPQLQKQYHCERSLMDDNKLFQETGVAQRLKINCNIRRFLETSSKNLSSCVKKLSVNAGDVTFDKSLDFRRVMLVVSFNKPHYEALVRVHRLYRGLFFKIIYCVTDIEKLKEESQNADLFAKLINKTIFEFHDTVTSPTGSLFYLCVPIVYKGVVLQHKYRIDGILQISDDLVVNLWNYRHGVHSLAKNWLPDSDFVYDVDSGLKCQGKDWDNEHDCNALVNYDVWTKSRFIAADALTDIEQRFPEFTENLASANHGYRRVRNTYVDLFYIPAKSLPLASELFRAFAKHKLYMEFVIGNVLRGISVIRSSNEEENERSNLQLIPRIGHLVGTMRSKPPSVTYDARYWLYHPFKMSAMQGWPLEDQCIYCYILLRMDFLRQRYPVIC